MRIVLNKYNREIVLKNDDSINLSSIKKMPTKLDCSVIYDKYCVKISYNDKDDTKVSSLLNDN